MKRVSRRLVLIDSAVIGLDSAVKRGGKGRYARESSSQSLAKSFGSAKSADFEARDEVRVFAPKLGS